MFWLAMRVLEKRNDCGDSMTSKDNIIFYTITAVVFVGIVVCSLLFHNAGQPTNGGSDSGFMTIIEFSPFVTAGATVVLAFITLRYVRLTQEILKATNKPQVILYLHYDNQDVSLCVENIGTGYASDVNFEGSLLSFKQMRLDGLTLEELEPFKSGINYLGSGYKIETYLFSSGQLSSIEKNLTILLLITKIQRIPRKKRNSPLNLVTGQIRANLYLHRKTMHRTDLIELPEPWKV